MSLKCYLLSLIHGLRGSGMPIAFCILLDFTASLISVWSGVRNLDELYIFGHLFGQVLEIYLVT